MPTYDHWQKSSYCGEGDVEPWMTDLVERLAPDELWVLFGCEWCRRQW